MATALTSVLALTACGGGGGGSSPAVGLPEQPPGGSPAPVPLPSSAATSAVTPLVSERHFYYNLTREGQAPITKTGSRSLTLSCPDEGCFTRLDGMDDTGRRGGLQTVRGTSAVDNLSYRHYGFWGSYGYGAVVMGDGTLVVPLDGHTWGGPSSTAHAWIAGEVTGTNPTGTGSAIWKGIAEAARTADFQHLRGTVQLRIPDLSQPMLDADINLIEEGGSTRPLKWRYIPLAQGSFDYGAAGQDRLQGRFHGLGHGEAWGLFHTDAYMGAFGAKREQQ